MEVKVLARGLAVGPHSEIRRWREQDSNLRFSTDPLPVFEQPVPSPLTAGPEILVSHWNSTDLVWLRPLEGLGALAPPVEEFGDADARTSMRLWLELFPPTDIQGMLAAFAQRDLLLWGWSPKQGNEPTLQRRPEPFGPRLRGFSRHASS
jgi:hypothetical protein